MCWVDDITDDVVTVSWDKLQLAVSSTSVHVTCIASHYT